MEIYARVSNEKGELIIAYDEDPVNPREEWDNLGTMVCWHKRYQLGDKHDFNTPQDFQKQINDKNAIILPLYLLDHSGLKMSMRSFNDPWDSGQVGWIYVTREKIRQEYGVKKISAELKKRVLDILRGEVETYDQYLSGQVFGFIVKNKNGEEVDSCWGFFGDDFNENGMRDQIPEEYRDLLDDVASL